MRQAVRRPVVLLAAGALAAVAVLAGCGSGSDQQRSSAAVADLRAKAAMAPCPKPAAPEQPARPDPSTPSVTPTPSVSSGASTLTGAVGQKLPRGTLPCLAGGPDVPLRRLTGVPLVINLWATWCVYCRTELPAFQAAFAHADPDRLRVLGVATQDPGLTRELSFAVDAGLHMPNLVDDKGILAAQVGARGLPATLFVAPDGSLVHMYNGPPLTAATLRDLIERYLRVTIRG